MRLTLKLGLLGFSLAGLLSACAAVGTLADEDGEGAGGGPGNAEPLNCARTAAETAAGQCVGTVLSFCVTGELRTVDCAVVGAACGLEPATQVFACRQPMAGQPDPQPGVPEPGGGPPEPAPGPGANPEPAPPPEPEAPVGLPCEAMPDGTECDGDTIIICRDGEPSGRTDCAANGLSCGPVPSGGVGCVADGGGAGGGQEPEPEAPMPPGGDGICGGRDGGARCDGNTVVQCRGGQEDSRFDCASNGQTCQIFDNTWAGCEGENQNPNVPNPEPEPPVEECTIVNFFGRCVGNVLEGCNLIDMEVFRVDCTFLGATCRQQDGLFGCW